MSESISISEYTLPRSAVLKILKSHLPTGTHVSADGKALALRAATVWINYVTATAVDAGSRVSAAAVLAALQSVHMDAVAVRVQEHLQGWKALRDAKKHKQPLESGVERGEELGVEQEERGEESGVEQEERGEESGVEQEEREEEQELQEQREEQEDSQDDIAQSSENEKEKSEANRGALKRRLGVHSQPVKRVQRVPVD